MTTDYLTAQEAADYLRSSPSTLAKRRLDGSGPVFYRIGTSIRYRRSDLDRWMGQSASQTSLSLAPRQTPPEAA
jgi:excisionase family DNA binding protein